MRTLARMPLPLRRALTSAVVLVCLLNLPTTSRAHEPALDALAQTMTEAADTWLASLDDDQRPQAVFAVDDPERTNWHFVPMVRRGLPLKVMNATQRAAALRLLHTALSSRGSHQALAIMQLEKVLHELENGAPHRDPDLYYVAIFGTPGHPPWGWRVEGHHLSVNQTITDRGISGSPLFFGANPGRVPSGPQAGQRVLGAEEDRGRAFVLSLDAAQRRAAIIAGTARHEIETAQETRVNPLAPVGITFTALTPDQQTALRNLLQYYLFRHEDEISAAALARIEAHGLEHLVFAWAGPTEPGAGHYYRIQGPTFVIEYGNTQNDANHHHTVFRDFDDDFGRDLFGDHYRTDH